MDQQSILPPLPPSDAASLQRNAYHGFYKTGAKEFWGENEVSHHEMQPFTACRPHFFMHEGPEVRCQVCHMGWVAPAGMIAQNGQLYFRDEPVQL